MQKSSEAIASGAATPAESRPCDWTGRLREGHLSATDVCFDIGNTVRDALVRFEKTGDAFCGSTSPYSAGNGSIMRLAPVVLFYHPDSKAVDRYAAQSSRTTHGADEAVAACRMLAAALDALLSGASKADALAATPPAAWMSERLQGIAHGEYMSLDRAKIRGSGYVVDSLEAALWCFHRTSSFDEAVLAAANLGEDADTTAAVCGQLAGACYGARGIPPGWLDRLLMREEIEGWADRYARAEPPPLHPREPWPCSAARSIRIWKSPSSRPRLDHGAPNVGPVAADPWNRDFPSSLPILP